VVKIGFLAISMRVALVLNIFSDKLWPVHFHHVITQSVVAYFIRAIIDTLRK